MVNNEDLYEDVPDEIETIIRQKVDGVLDIDVWEDGTIKVKYDDCFWYGGVKQLADLGHVAGGTYLNSDGTATTFIEVNKL